jgi:hypothetical protein
VGARGWLDAVPSFASHLVTGRAGVVTARDARLVDRYLAPALEGAIAMALPELPKSAERRADLEALRDTRALWTRSARSAGASCGSAGAAHYLYRRP